ncbi:MAG: helix-turn-helix domain-containing protein [Desulfobacterales bacterium]|nr:helix-turn-helix domain-containing protein [Desulfobacterales bacterium]
MKTNNAYIPVLDNLIQSLRTDDIDDGKYEWLSPTQVSSELGIHINTVYRIIQKRELRSFNCSVDGRRNYYRIRRVDLNDYLDSRKCGW